MKYKLPTIALFVTIAALLVVGRLAMMNLATPPAVDHYGDSPTASTPAPVQGPKFKIGACVQYKEGAAYTGWGDNDGKSYNQLPVADYEPVKDSYKYTLDGGATTFNAYEDELEPCTEDRKQ